MNRLRSSRSTRTFGNLSTCVGGLFVLTCALSLPGCLLLDWSSVWFLGEAGISQEEARSNPLKKIPTSRTAVTLEIVFVERPVGDPLLGSQLWDEIDQIGTLPAAERESLEKIGLRVGRVGASPPRALQTLMGLASEVGASDEKQLVGRRVVLPSGAETEINTGLPHLEASINIPSTAGMELKQFDNIRGVFRMKAKQLQPGWARVEFQPEIHHGRMVNRPVAVRGGWQLNTAQAIERLYSHRFSLDLNMGEMVVITGEVLPDETIGKYFFHSSELTGSGMNHQFADPAIPDESSSTSSKPGIQRLLIVRLADLSTADSMYSK